MSSATFISTLPTDDASWQIHHNQPTPRVHQITLLLHLCPRPLPFLPLLEAEALALDRFYILTRYHELLPRQ